MCFHWNAGVEVRVPVHCLEAIRCLAECLTQTDRQHAKAFQEVVVKA